MATTTRDPKSAGRKTTTSRAFDAQLAAAAPNRHAVFSLQELCDFGVTASAVRPQDITVVDGIVVTTIARTLLDLAAVVPRRGLERGLDAVWRDQKVVLELDGERPDRTRRAFHHDRVRDQRLVAAGWRVIRTRWEQLTERPNELAAVLQQILR
jgi:very-short-patch-repair endonuclease